VACGAINGVIAAIGTIIVTSRPEIQLQAHFFGIALGNGELEASVCAACKKQRERGGRGEGFPPEGVLVVVPRRTST